MTTKICTKCLETKELEEFTIQRTCKQGRHSQCKKCLNTLAKKYRVSKSGKARMERYYADNKSHYMDIRLKRIYNITLEQYNEMCYRQSNCCAICNRSRELFKRNFAVDHCHETGKIRGLLCVDCNTILGKARDSEEVLLKTIKYLKDYDKCV